MRHTPAIILILATLTLATASFVGLWHTEVWWVRMTDFPRLQYTIALVLLLLALVWVRPLGGTARLFLAGLAVAALAVNCWKLWPYFVTEAAAAQACPADRRATVMIANVQASHEQPEGFLQTVRGVEPDLLLAMETDGWWDAQLATLHDAYPHRQQEVTDGYYGIHLLSKVELENPQVVRPAGTETPAVIADVTLGPDRDFRFIGLHPRPPHPSQSAQARDAQLMWAALEARGSDLPVVVAGDLNSTPWESVVERLQRVGGLLDPRQVFGYHATYDAHSWWMYWPLDHVFHQPEMSAVGMDVLPGFGSDHYPVVVELCHRPSAFQPPEQERGDVETAREAVGSNDA